MNSHQIHIFISHAWKYSQHYEKLAEWIFDGNWNVGGVPLDFRDYSVPKDNPIHNAPSKLELRDAIFNQIARSHIVLIPTGMYANYSDWIKKELEGAELYEKPILAVNLNGQKRMSGAVADKASSQVGWRKESVVNEVWKLYKTSCR